MTPDLYNGAPLDFEDLQVKGVSLSGIRTSLAVPSLHLAFDVGQGFPYLFSMNRFFMTHVHLDHAAGIPYLIAQKNMYHHKPPQFFMPASMIDGMHEIMRAWEKMEGHTYKYEFLPVDEKFELEVKPGYLVRAFKTVHRVESFGYTIFTKNKKLKPHFQNQTSDEIRKKRSEGEEVQEFFEAPLMSFTGDTQIEFLDSAPWIRKSKYLFLEATYIDEAKPVAVAREWGHTHLDEIIPQLESLECEKVILIHISSRYSTQYAQDVLRKRLPKELQSKVIVFPGR